LSWLLAPFIRICIRIGHIFCWEIEEDSVFVIIFQTYGF
jgi:hypothetical protein